METEPVLLKGLLKTLVQCAPFSEEFYLEAYADIAEAYEAGQITDLHRHYIDFGYFEGRLPFPIRVDERWYLAQHPDVAESIRLGLVGSAQEHFERDGYREGRLPFGM